MQQRVALLFRDLQRVARHQCRMGGVAVGFPQIGFDEGFMPVVGRSGHQVGSGVCSSTGTVRRTVRILATATRRITTCSVVPSSCLIIRVRSWSVSLTASRPSCSRYVSRDPERNSTSTSIQTTGGGRTPHTVLVAITVIERVIEPYARAFRRRRNAARPSAPVPSISREAGSGTGGVTLNVPVASAVASAIVPPVIESPGMKSENDSANPRGMPNSAGLKTAELPEKLSGGSEALRVGLDPPALPAISSLKFTVSRFTADKLVNEM